MSWQRRSWLVLGCLLGSVPPAWADGCLLSKRGTYVPEKEQSAYIEWEAGRERLYVATRAEPSQGPALWLLPIPSPPEQVTVEPVQVFPHVSPTKPFVEAPREHLRHAAELTVCLDSAGLAAPMLLGKTANATFQSVGAMIGGYGVTVHQHVEKFGLVAEVLTAKDLNALDRYLRDKEIGVSAKDVVALQPYFNQEYVFICAWPADSAAEVTARSLRIDFSYPRIYYPLRASRVYTAEINTSVFVRGWAQPVPGNNIADLRCRYVRTSPAVEATDKRTLGVSVLPNGAHWLWGPERPHTRVELPRSPQAWTEDLELDPHAPSAIQVAGVVQQLGPVGLWLVGGLQGAIFLAFLPLALFPRAERRGTDWVWACLSGAALLFSLLLSAIVFAAWMRARDVKRLESTTGTGLTVATFAFLLVFAVLTTASVMPRNPPPVVPWLAVVAFVGLFGCSAWSLGKTGRQGVVLLGFVLLHLSVNVGVLIALDRWLGLYV